MSRTSCYRSGCNGIRSDFNLFLSRRKAPNFEDHAFCGEACLEAYLGVRLRERWNALRERKVRAFPRPRLGALLILSGKITPDQLEQAMALQKETGEGRIGEWLIRLGYIEEREITSALSDQLAVPVINLKPSESKPAAAWMIPGKVARRSRLLAVGYDEARDALRIAVSGPVDSHVHMAIRRMLGKGVVTFVSDQSVIDAMIPSWYGDDNDIDNSMHYSSLDGLFNIGRHVVRRAAGLRASNIRIELLEDYLWVRNDSESGRHHDVYPRVNIQSPADSWQERNTAVSTGTY